MRNRTKPGTGSLLPTVLTVLAVLVAIPVAVEAQLPQSPSSNSTGSAFGNGNSFGGGLGGNNGGFGGLSGGASGSTNGLTGASGGNQGYGGFRGGFFGQMPNNATGYQGGTAGGASATSGTSSSAFGKYYYNPKAPGAPNASGTVDFFQPIYGGGGAGFRGSSNYNSPASNNSQLGSNTYPGGGASGNTAGARRQPTYAVGSGFSYRPPGPSVIAEEVERILARSTGLSPNRTIRVVVDGPAVVLRGTVASDHDRRLAEALVRLSPGVYQVRNELDLPAGTPPAESEP